MEPQRIWRELTVAYFAGDAAQAQQLALSLLVAEKSGAAPPTISGRHELAALNWKLATAGCRYILDRLATAGSDAVPPGEAAGPATLAEIEQWLMSGATVVDYVDPEEEEPPLLPTAQIHALADVDLFDWFISLVPLHVVDGACDCEPEAESPYVLAWQNELGCFVRQLTAEESRLLQMACVASRNAVEAPVAAPPSAPPVTQRTLW